MQRRDIFFLSCYLTKEKLILYQLCNLHIDMIIYQRGIVAKDGKNSLKPHSTEQLNMMEHKTDYYRLNSKGLRDLNCLSQSCLLS